MPKPVKKGISFDSADGHSRVAGYFYESEAAPPFCVLQISHGMCEHMPRYEDFATFLCENGVAVCGNDHIGHGASAGSEDDLGYFSEKDGRRFAIEDLKTMNEKAREAFPGLPVILLGHSMGSFFARQYAVRYPQTIDGLILSGTGGPNPLVGTGIALAGLVGKMRGPRYRSKLVHNMAFGAYLKNIPNPRTPYDWISRDEDIVDVYAADPYCTFHFTVNGFRELFYDLRDVSGPQWAAAMPKELPVYLFSGDADPVGDYGKGVETVRGWLSEAGVRDLSCKLYAGGRHEMLNEVNRDEVYRDVLAFLQRWNPSKSAQAATTKV